MRKKIYILGFTFLLCLQCVIGAASAKRIGQGYLAELEGLQDFSEFKTAFYNESYGSARDVINQMIYNYPDQLYLYYVRGALSMELEDYAGAEADIAYYLALNPNDVNAYKINMTACAMMQSYETALEYCSSALSLAPDDQELISFHEKIAAINANRAEQAELAAGGQDVSSQIQAVFDLVNEERSRQGLSPLKLHNDLNEAAAVRAEEIATVFSHTRPNGESFSTAINVSYRGAGENIASGMPTAQAVMMGWMESPGHRDNIMKPQYEYIGIGYVFKNGSPHWVQLFMY